MIPLCPLKVWCNSVYAPLRCIRGFGSRSKILRRKRAESWITLPRIVRFRSIFTQALDTKPEVPQKFKVKGSKVKVTANVTLAKIRQIVNNSAGYCSISIEFSTVYDHVPPDLPQTFKVNGSKIKVIAWHDVLAWKNRHISWTDSLTEFKLCATYPTA